MADKGPSQKSMNKAACEAEAEEMENAAKKKSKKAWGGK